jgi:hypothetical protein
MGKNEKTDMFHNRKLKTFVQKCHRKLVLEESSIQKTETENDNMETLRVAPYLMMVRGFFIFCKT